MPSTSHSSKAGWNAPPIAKPAAKGFGSRHRKRIPWNETECVLKQLKEAPSTLATAPCRVADGSTTEKFWTTTFAGTLARKRCVASLP